MNKQLFLKEQLIEWSIKLINNKAKIVIDKADFQNKVINKIENGYYKEKLGNNWNDDVIIDEIEYEDISREILIAVGYVKERHSTYLSWFPLKHKNDNYDLCQNLALDFSHWLQKTMKEGIKVLEIADFIEEVIDKYGFETIGLALELVNGFADTMNASPYYKVSKYGSADSIKLADLYNKENSNNIIGKYFDQRFIDYLNKNNEEVGGINWRQFERFSAEYFEQKGYKVKLGPGRKDGGIDLVIENNGKKIVAQCKQYNNKVGVSAVRELDDIILREDFDSGIIICVRDVSQSGKKLIDNKKMKIKIMNNKVVSEMVDTLSSI